MIIRNTNVYIYHKKYNGYYPYVFLSSDIPKINLWTSNTIYSWGHLNQINDFFERPMNPRFLVISFRTYPEINKLIVGSGIVLGIKRGVPELLMCEMTKYKSDTRINNRIWVSKKLQCKFNSDGIYESKIYRNLKKLINNIVNYHKKPRLIEYKSTEELNDLLTPPKDKPFDNFKDLQQYSKDLVDSALGQMTIDVFINKYKSINDGNKNSNTSIFEESSTEQKQASEVFSREGTQFQDIFFDNIRPSTTISESALTH